MAAPTDYISAINEVKQWLSYKSLDEFIYLLVDHGYDDLSALAQCSAAELDELVQLFTTPESKSAIAAMVHALTQIGIDVYRKQKGEFRRLIELDDRAKKQNDITEQVSRVRGESMAIKPPPSLDAAAAAPASASASSTAADSSTSAATAAASNSASAGASAGADADATKLPPSTSSSTPAASDSSNSRSASASATGSAAGSASASSASPSSSAADSASNPTLGWDVESWDGAVRFQAYVNSVATHARLLEESGPQAPPVPSMVELEHKFLAGRSRGQLDKLARFMRALCEGAMFKKYKRGSAAKRLIWTSAALDFVCWGEEDASLGGRRTVKGYIATAEIQEINQGFAAKTKNRLYIVSPERTLELEAKDANQSREWKEMLEALIQLNMSELECKQTLMAGEAFGPRFARSKADNTKLLSTGSVFKKTRGPGKLGAPATSFTTRLVWTPPVPDRLQWGDIVSKKVVGFVLMQDIVHVEEDLHNPAKLTVYAMKRSLDLEARNEATRERWVRALRFFVEFKQKALQP